MHAQERVTLSRDCDAVMVPAGARVVIKSGADVDICQTLGGSFTVIVQGQMYRIDGDDADALGKEPPPKPELGDSADDAEVEGLVWDQLSTCFDPEIPINIVELGLVYDCRIELLAEGFRRVEIDMTLTAPGCGMGDIIASDVQRKLLEVPTVQEAEVQVVFDPPWNSAMMSEAARLQTGMF